VNFNRQTFILMHNRSQDLRYGVHE